MHIDILSEQEVAVLRELIAASSNIVIVCHKSPDGDALGSSLAWAEYLRVSHGKEPVTLVPDAFPDYLLWLPNSEKLIRYDKNPERGDLLLKTADLVFCMDFNESSRTELMQATLDACAAQKVMIDHHLDPRMDTVLTVSHPELSSTSEIVFRIVWQMGGFEAMKKHFAVPVYCGMMTDTGSFTYNSTYPEIYFIVSQLLTKHINKDLIYRKVYNNYSHWAIRLRGYLMCEKLKVFEEFHASCFSLSAKEMRDFHFVRGDMEGLVNEPLRIKGLKLSISLREDDRKENLVWVSLRSVDDFPCNKMAEEFFNGGGHLNASGGRLYCSLEEAEKVAVKAIQSYAEILKK
ncbi:MAG: DHH family phosphoesterase [Prevotella sp.]|nr:DHH family phosphoesterase [Prevotella sp.]MBR7086686.1 DHH family phosphoesterase [Prevotella sp.]